MTKDIPHALSSVESIQTLLDTLDWQSLEPNLVHQHGKSFDILADSLLAESIDFFVYPLGEIPFDRDPAIQLAAVSTRIDARFYLKNKTDKKNLAFIAEGNTLWYSDSSIIQYIQSINQKLQLKSCPFVELLNQELAIGVGKFGPDTHALSPEEFTPTPAAGVYCLICRKEDFPTRKRLAHFHNDSSLEISNLERQIQQHFYKREDVQLVGAYVEMDKQANYHGTMAVLYKGVDRQEKLGYYHHSQSTSHLFVANIIQKTEK